MEGQESLKRDSLCVSKKRMAPGRTDSFGDRLYENPKLRGLCRKFCAVSSEPYVCTKTWRIRSRIFQDMISKKQSCYRAQEHHHLNVSRGWPNSRFFEPLRANSSKRNGNCNRMETPDMLISYWSSWKTGVRIYLLERNIFSSTCLEVV